MSDNMDEHWIIAKIETDENGMPIIGEQASIGGQTEFSSREDCWSAMHAANALSLGLHPIRIPKSARFLVELP